MNFFSSVAKDLGKALEEHVSDALEEHAAAGQDKKEPEVAPKAQDTQEEGADFDEKVKLAIPGMIRMISGCADHQTSADVGSTEMFDLPENSGPGGAGGACTNALLEAFADTEDLTWVQLLDAMRSTLQRKGFEQIPQLSSSRKLDVNNDKLSILNPAGGGKRKAVLIGINYIGQRGELRGCHNDVIAMKQFITKHGFKEDEIQVLMDDGSHTSPTGKNILAAFDWLVDDAESGDSLFLHYSGHGGYVTDTNGDEKDGRDETIVPVDFKSCGQIIDDLIYKEVVMPIPKGCQLTCVMDCCHSGSVFDLPYYVKATEQLEGSDVSMAPNPGFSFQQLLNIAKKLYTMKSQGASNSQLAQHAAREIMPMVLSMKKPTGGLSNLFSALGSSGSGNSGLPSLPF